MLKERRHKRILAALDREGSVELNELAQLMPEVSRVTLRRDIADLADAGALKRTHGGAVVNDEKRLRHSGSAPTLVAIDSVETNLNGLDGVVLPPVEGRGADALRRQISRRALPFLAESSAQPGGVYLGPDNFAAGRELGEKAGQNTNTKTANILLVCQPELANTRARAEGFIEGFTATFSGDLSVIRVNGKGNYKTALRVASDALVANDEITLGFGVNDHSALGLMDAAERFGRTLNVFACGGENPNFLGRLAQKGPLVAVAAFFPTLVGEYAIDLLAHALRGHHLPSEALTPHVIVTTENLLEFCTTNNDIWSMRGDYLNAIDDVPMRPSIGGKLKGRIGFMPHYPAHDWYRSMIQAMRSRSDEYGLDLIVEAPHHGIAAEVSRLRGLVANAALERVEADQTIILGEGDTTLKLAERLRARAFDNPQSLSGVTIISNSLDILAKLEGAPSLKVILTSGEYQAADRCLVGPSLGALFERMKADLAFLSVSGVTPEFGISNVDERLALAASRFVQASKRTVALADHTLVGTDANYRIAPIGGFDELITDDGVIPGDRQKLRAAGIEVSVAEDADPAPAMSRGTNQPHLQTA
ncbi:MAG: substrate-binding domain-containing protein [Pseudomonadota bacterium]